MLSENGMLSAFATENFTRVSIPFLIAKTFADSIDGGDISIPSARHSVFNDIFLDENPVEHAKSRR